MIVGCDRLRGCARPLVIVLFAVCLAGLGAQSKKPVQTGDGQAVERNAGGWVLPPA
jgi:hypothetical protein